MRRLVLLLLISSALASDSDEAIEKVRNLVRERLSNEMFSPSGPSTSVSTSSSFFPFGVMSGMISSMRKAVDDDGNSVERKRVEALHEDRKSSGSSEEDDDESSINVGQFTEVLGNLFGKLASTLGGENSNPSGGRSSFGIADVLGTTLTQLKGPHICIREINEALETVPNNKTRRYSSECQYYSQAVRCATSKVNEDEARKTIRIQECCEGFTSTNIRARGCTIETKRKSPVQLFKELHSTQNASEVPRLGTVIVSEKSSKALLFTEIFSDYDLVDGRVLTTTDGKKFLVKVEAPITRISYSHVSINCVKLAQANIPMTTGKGHISEKAIRPAAENVLELLKTDGRFNKFISLLPDETVTAFANASSSFTILPFTDDAFKKFPASIQEQITNRISCFSTGIARAHIFQPAICSDSLTKGLGDAKIVEADLVAMNGIVHVVSDVIVKEDLETWEEKLKKIAPEFVQKLSGKIDVGQPISIFVPSTMMKKDIEGEEEGSGQEERVELTEDQVMNHVVPWYLPSVKVIPPKVTTMLNSTIFAGNFKSSASSLFSFRSRNAAEFDYQIGCSKFIPDPVYHKQHIGACGAAIYFLDRPIPTVTHNIETFLLSRPDLSRFNDLFASYPKTKDAAFHVATVFVPVNDAFSVNDMKRLQGSHARTVKFVKRHLISRPICEHDFLLSAIRSLRISNKNGELLRYTVEDGGTFVEESKILESVVVSNGVIHIVDNALSSTTETKSGGSKNSFIRLQLH